MGKFRARPPFRPVGPVFEDGSFRVRGGVYDPDSGGVRRRVREVDVGRSKREWVAKQVLPPWDRRG